MAEHECSADRGEEREANERECATLARESEKAAHIAIFSGRTRMRWDLPRRVQNVPYWDLHGIMGERIWRLRVQTERAGAGAPYFHGNI